jgi:hypothetical protein
MGSSSSSSSSFNVFGFCWIPNGYVGSILC